MIGALPSAVLGEVALVPRGTEGVGGHIHSNAEVVPREANMLDTVLVAAHPESDEERARW